MDLTGEEYAIVYMSNTPMGMVGTSMSDIPGSMLILNCQLKDWSLIANNFNYTLPTLFFWGGGSQKAGKL